MTSEDTLINASAFIISCWIKLSTVINVIIQQQGASTVYVSAQEVRDVSKRGRERKIRCSSKSVGFGVIAVSWCKLFNLSEAQFPSLGCYKGE